jgi:transposase
MSPDLSAADAPQAARIAELEAQVAALLNRVATLEHENATLREQLATAQRAQHRQATPFARGKRNPTPQKPGRRAGQGRFTRRLPPPPEQVDCTVEVPLPACPTCGGAVRERATHEQFQVDLPPVQPVVTRFVTHSGYCAACRCRTHSRHPEQISPAMGAAGVVVGPRAKALAADLHHRFGASYGKISELFRSFFALPLTRGGLAQADTRLAAQAEGVYAELLTAIRAAAVVHGDETGWRIGTLSAWLWVFTSQHVTVYTIATSRGHEVILSVLGREFEGVLVADCFTAYDARALADWLQQKCLAHLLKDLRELEASKTRGAVRFARDVTRVLRAALALRDGRVQLPAAEFAQQVRAVEAELDQLIAPRRQLSDPDNRRLAKRLRKQRRHLLRFLADPAVPATNNAAERALRPAVITRKTGGCHRTEGGARAHAVLASVLATCRQQAISGLDYLIKLQQFGETPPSLVPT